MNNKIMGSSKDNIEAYDYFNFIDKDFSETPDIAKPLILKAGIVFRKIEEALYSAPAIINAIYACIPEEAIQLAFTDEQKTKLAKGVLKLMTKKDGSLMANLVNPKTNKIIETVSLEKVKITPELTQAMTNYAMQMQMAQIAKQIEFVQIAIEEVRQGQENDRLATAYSCQQKLLQALTIKNPEIKQDALLRIAFDAEESRNLLMLSQSENVKFIKEQPEAFWKKLLVAEKTEKINSRMDEVRDSLLTVNMVSLAEAIAYQELGEDEAARMSLQYYSKYIHDTYFADKGFVERLDLIDPSPKSYWSQTLPKIVGGIQALPCNKEVNYIEGEEYGKDM